MPTYSTRSRVVVVGSANVDLVLSAPEIPAPGQTVLATDLREVLGGKGANQAVAAARLGADVAFVGRVGDDAHGQKLRAGLQAAGVDCTFLRTTPGVPSGLAIIVVSAVGENAICVAPGANAALTPADVDAAHNLLTTCSVCVLQLEIPLATAAHAARRARAAGAELILDPAPVPPAEQGTLPAELLAADVLTPNLHEARRLLAGADAAPPRGARSLGAPSSGAQPSEARSSGAPLSGMRSSSAPSLSAMPSRVPSPAELAARLRACGARQVVLKLGADGCYVSSAARDGALRAHAITVIDTTAAGDAFTAGLAAGRAAGLSLWQAAELANAAGALACTRLGAQPSLPSRAAIAELLGRDVLA